MSEEAREILSRSLVHQIERLTAERDALRAQLTTERHKVSCLREDIRLEREARQIVEEQIEELLKKSQGEG